MPTDPKKSGQNKARHVASQPPSPRWLDSAVTIRLDPETTERAFMTKQLVQCTLPHRNPGRVEEWTRRNGSYTLSLRPGKAGYPFGTIPRLLLFWLTTTIVQTRRRRIELGEHLSDFMWEVGLDPSRGGKRSDAKRLRDQMERLFRCTISFDEKRGRGSRWLDMQIAPAGELWWDPREPDQGDLWGSWLEVSEMFFNATLAAPVPLDKRALRGLRPLGPLALDFYAWANHRVYNLQEAAFIPWRSLAEQMGANYGEVREFARQARKALQAVQAVSHIKLSFPKTGGGLWLHPSPPAVAQRPVRTFDV